ncbi:hypothetical protein JIN77_03590 [Verrucomicrobiaceae bacterium R5-34]|nr:hypothetical protein [Verrucomicrobiaceae bacterium R5-34]
MTHDQPPADSNCTESTTVESITEELPIDANQSEQGSTKDREQSQTEVDDTKHPIPAAINRALHKYRDIEAVARILVPVSATIQKDMWDTAHEALKSAQAKIDDEAGQGQIDEVVAAELDEAFVALDRLGEANLPDTLLTSLFLGLFSAFDAFTGNLLVAIYKKKPELLEALNVEIPLTELLQHESFDELKDAVLLDEIEKFRRKSYIEQFDQLERRFGLKLKKFDHWSQFVELGQRRNLITHCEGIVSKQYLKVCRENGVVIKDNIEEGHRLEVHPRYLFAACSIVYEVSLKLGQTLWRKIFPEEHDAANEHLTEPIYEALRIERWDRAILLSEFAASVQSEIRDLDRRIRVINLCIALRFSEQEQKCKDMLASEDWSAAALDFRLAVEVLHERFEEASNLMRQIGKNGELINQKAYHVWPLFRDFRRSEHFTAAYEEVFDTTYGSGVAAEASKAEEKEPEAPTNEESKSEDLDHERFRPSLSVIKRIIG